MSEPNVEPWPTMGSSTAAVCTGDVTSSAIGWIVVSLESARPALESAVAALGTRLMIGLMPEVLSVLLLDMSEGSSL